FIINSTSRLEHQGRKGKLRALEALIIESVLLGLCIMLARGGTGDVVDGERTGDCHINCKPRPLAQLEMVTSPGRRPGLSELPRMPFFSITDERPPSEQKRSTRL